jgi:hypothetical protein
MPDTEAAQILPDVSTLKRKKALRALRDVSAIPRRTLDADTRRAATCLLQAASPLRHRMVRNTRELLRRYKLPVPQRDPREVVVEMTPAESALYTAVEDFIGDMYREAPLAKRSAVGFVMTVYRRRLASSFEALKRTLNGRLMRSGGLAEEDASQDETSDEVMSVEEVTALAAEAPELDGMNERERIHDLLRRIAQLGAIQIARARPAEMDFRPLDPGSYHIGLPGRAPIRVTTDPGVFEFSSDNVQLYSAGGDAFGAFSVDATGGVADGRGIAWMVQRPGAEPEFVVATRSGPRTVGNFEELLAALEMLGDPCDFPLAAWPGVTASLIA